MDEQTEQGQPQVEQSNETFEGWLAAQPDGVKALYNSHASGLKSALDTERETRKGLEKQLRDMAKKAEQGSEAQRLLTEQADKLSTLERQTSFYAEAHAAGVRNLRLAYIAATTAGLIDDKGRADFGRMKADFPELFLSPPAARAGDGSNGGPKPLTMNEQIRRAAGR
jgi:hypothetical protein